jgi:hypothetical protein
VFADALVPAGEVSAGVFLFPTFSFPDIATREPERRRRLPSSHCADGYRFAKMRTVNRP